MQLHSSENGGYRKKQKRELKKHVPVDTGRVGLRKRRNIVVTHIYDRFM